MSEEIDYDTNSLYTGVTEDVFEEFQARSMHYQEEELTLPLNGSTCVDQPSFSDSKYNCPEIEVTSTIEDIQEDECLANVYFNCSNESDDLDLIKNVPDTQNLEICTTEPNTSTFDVLDNFKNTDEGNISQNAYKKRGRKKKNDSSKVADNMSVTLQQNTTQRRGRKKKTEVTQSTLDNETENIVEVKEPLKSRIRNKRLPKSKLNNTSSVGPNSEEISPETIPQLDDLNLFTDPEIVNNDVSMKIDDTTQNIFCDTPVAGETKTSGRRRGKPRGRGGRRGKVQRIAASEANSCKNNEITMDISNDQMNKIKGESSDEEDNECLSKLKGTLGDNVNQIIEADSEEVLNLQDKATELEETALTPSKRNIKIPMMDDYEYNVDTVIKETVVKEVDAGSASSLLEDINIRPSRRQVKKTLQYRDESDEDPFANMGSSEEDEPKKGKHHYYSDEEYIPGSKKTRHSYLDSSEEEFDEDLQEVKKLKRKKSKLGKSPTKAKKLATEESNQCTLTSSNTVDDELCEVEDIEQQLQPTFIGNNAKSDETSATQSWGTSREFENFLAKKIQGSQLKIKKISTASEANNSLTPLEIPMIDPKEMKKFVDVDAQTDKVKTTSFWTQTCAPNAVKMKDNVDLTEKQSENACEFLKSVFQKTSSLGQLMTKKSDAFVEKKIKTSFVKDTFGIDSCVEKTFLLIKLAKNDLQQMEDNLAMEYDNFLETNNLIAYKETEKKIKPRLTQENNDSDCEIIEAPDEEPKAKPKFNPKTVFLNKELSIKIAKKPSATNEPKENKINIKGKSAVWINKSIMVKKVKPTQSFLAQDSRNKKPPDSCVTYKMVNDFFKSYFRQRALKICAPFVSTDWFTASKNQIICNYFFVKQDNFPGCVHNGDLNETSNDLNNVDDSEEKVKKCNECTLKLQSLSSLCLAVLRKQMQIMEHQKNASVCRSSLVVDDNLNQSDFRIRKNVSPINGVTNENCVPETIIQETVLHCHTLQTLSSLCLDVLKNQIQINDEKLLLPTFTDIKNKKIMNKNHLEPFSVFVSDLNTNYPPNCIFKKIEQSVLPTSRIKRLLLLCLDVIKTQMKTKRSEEHTVLKYIVDTATLHGKMDKYIQFVDGVNRDTHEKYSTKDVFRNNNSEVLNTSASQTLLVLCLDVLKKQMQITKCKDIFIDTSFFNGVRNDSNENYPLEKELKKVKQSEDFESLKLSSLCPDTLKHISFIKLRNLLNENIIFNQIAADQRSNTAKNKVKPLSTICFQYISTFIDSNVITTTEATHGIDNVVALSDYAFVNIADSTNLNVEDNDSQYSDNGSVMNNDEYESYCEDQDENYPMENNWVSQVQMETLMSYDPCSNITENEQEDENIMTNQTVLSQVKMEPEDIITNIKEETDFSLEDISILPDSVCTKQEVENQNVIVPLDSFEEFVSASKLMSLNEEDGVFSQSAARVRRQHAPDSDDENEYDMSLLVPHTFEPLQLNNAKETLMDSSSENEHSQLVKKKKIEKRGRGRPKKTDMKNNNNTGPSGDKVEEKSVVNSYVSVITKRMKEKIRQKAQNIESSDSENEIITKTKSDTSTRKLGSEANEKTSTMLEKNRQEEKSIEKSVSKNEKFEEKKSKDKDESNSSNHKTTRNKKVNDAIQYAEVDSTQCILPDKPSKINSTADIESNVENKEEDNSDVIDYDEPVELLECEPSLPMLEDEQVTPIGKRTKHKLNQSKKSSAGNEIPYIERHGWHCYPLDPKDEKVYGLTQVVLQKLPEEFVDTYNKYLEISVKNKEDAEVDRLINLQSLNRISNMGEKKRSVKDKVNAESKSKPAADTNVKDETYHSDHYAELTPSEDEGEGVEDQIPLEQPLCRTDNHLAKNSLMDDEESDTECDVAGKDSKSRKSNKSLLVKSKDIKREQAQQELMLTADKMMKTELNLLNTPVDLKKEVDESVQVSPPKEDKKKEDVKKKHKSSSKGNNRHNQEKSDDSSSEEEKLWVNTKEKLLKRMGKKQEDTSIEDAKRTKITNEFIVKRSDGDRRNRINTRGRSRRSYKKFLEHQKQLRVLSHELFGENSSHPGKKYSQSYARGRRNIRKVIDKKSLAKSTVIANMEEFERKRRLNTRQHKLREVLGVEEDVNVVVINDEVCLEYDFVTQQPVVTIHPFFTKVMKAHQYEGVKFMWDACFESLSTIHSGQPGGGCILAHCMGLGKTLQVLALLHTVMTHPQVGVRRVLVCCPLSTVLNWVDEIHKWIGPVTNKIKVFELSKLKKTYQRAYQLEDWYNGGGIFIIGYELFRSLSTLDPYLDNIRPTIVNKIRTALLDPGPDVVVCDEGHLLKNDCSVLAVAMSRVATRRRIILTGTPIQNNLREYYCMVNFVKPNLLGTYSEYSNRFENPIMNGQHRDSREEDIKLMKARTHILHKVLEGCLQRQEVSVLYPYLPKKHEYTVFISLTKCQWDLYKHYMNNYTGTHNKHSVLKDFHTLQKIWSHPQVLHNFETKARENINKPKVEKIEDEIAAEELAAAEDVKPSATETWWLPYLDGGDMLNTLEASNKFVAVFKILEECVQLGDKVLIFSTSLFTMDSLEYFLKKIKNWSLGTDYYRLDGSVPPEVRQKWCREFNAESNVETKLFLISTRAGCLGLNMVAANRVVILDTSWNPAHDVQSIFRVYRFGQKKDCFIYRLVALGTMEQKIYERAVTKQAVACRVVDEQQIDRHYNMSDLMELYRYDETGHGVAGGVAVGVQDVALLRVARLRALHAVHEHDSLLRGSLERDLPEDERAAAWMQFQQEQAHTHYQNQLAVNLPPQGRPYEHQYAQSPLVIPPPSTTSVQTPIPTVHTSIPENIQEDAPEQPSGPNKFIAFKQCIIPLERLPEIRKEKLPEKIREKPPNGDLDDSKIKEITNLLIKYNFHTNPPTKLSNMIKKIRYIVTTNQLDVLNDCDELTRNIANVMLGKEQTTANNVDFERVIDSQIKCKTDPVLPHQKSQSNKRKAALSAQKLISHQDPTVISIIDSSDDEWTPNRGVERSKTPVVERSQQDTDEVNRAVASLFNNTDYYSITLSDDEEQPRSTAVIKNEVANPTDSRDTQNDENLSLHPSLLNNENFIKIVAHTYLSGNPMLDEDAAVLAAKYSTDKIRAEYERTGNPISSGPIYDIALKVLGKEVMKKIHTGDSISPKKSTPKEMEPQVPTKAYKPGPKSKKARMAPIAEPMKAVVAPKVKMEEAAKVVPVSMFKGAGNITKAFDHLPDPGGECILPDDDFCIVDSNPSPPPLMRKNSQPLIINSILSKGGNGKSVVKEMNYLPIAPKPHGVTETGRRVIPILRRPLQKNNYVSIAPKQSRVSETGPLQKTTELTGGNLNMANSSGERTVIQQPELFVLGHDRTLTGRAVPTGHITKFSANFTAVGTTISLDSDDEETIVPTILHPTTVSSHCPPTVNTVFPTSVIDSSRLAPNSTAQQILLPHLNNVTGSPAQHILTPMSNNAMPGNKKFVLVSKSQIDSLKSATSSKEASNILRRMMNNPKPSVSASPPPLISVAHETGGVIAATALPKSTVFSATTSIEAPELESRLISTPTSAAQTQPTPLKEDIKKTKSTVDKSKVNFKCKPGDILRVTASGAFEVLTGQDDQAVAPKKKIAQVTNNDKKKVSASSKVALAKNEETTLKTQTSISDPLDILKDVVQIRADAYETPHEQTNTKVTAAASTKTVTNSQTGTPEDIEKMKKSVFAKAKEKLEALKSKVKMNTPPTKPTPARASKHDSIVNKSGAPVGRIVDTVDLTSFPSTSASRNTNRSGSDSKVSSLTKSSTVVGTSKSIVIGGCGKLATKTPISKDSPVKQTINLTKSYSNTTRNIVKAEPLKRPAPLILKTIDVKKKKKADSEMTLNDFDIDDLSDLEDIIELE